MRDRIKKLSGRLQQMGLSGALIQSGVNLLYLAGSMASGFLYVGDDGQAAFFVRKGLSRAQEESDVERIEPISSPKDLPARLSAMGVALSGTFGLELDVLSVERFSRTQALFPGVAFADVGGDLRLMRAVKGPSELLEIRRAAQLWREIVDEIPRAFAPGMDEFLLSAAMEGRARRAGHQGFIRTYTPDFEMHIGHVLSGPHGAAPTPHNGPTGGQGLYPAMPHGAGHRRIEKGDPILVDIAACQRGYIYDGTRTFAVGRLPDPLERAYDVARAIWERMPELLRPGLPVSRPHEVALEMAAGAGLAEHFMGAPGEQVAFVGHGVGLQLDELPVLTRRSRAVFEAGMTVAAEPKFVFPGVGAVGIEDTFEVTDRGGVPLSGYPPELFRLEG